MARSRSSEAARRPTGTWLFNAPVDLLIGAGAWTIPLLALTAFASRHAGLDVAFAFAVLTLVCNHPHYMATIHRAYAQRDLLLHHRRYTISVTAALILVLVAAHGAPALRPVIVSAYLFWSPWHYTGQNFGLVLLFARRHGAVLAPGDRQRLFAGFAASYGVWLVNMQSRPSDDPYVLSLALDPVIANALAILLAMLMCAAFGSVAVRLARRTSLRACAPSAVLGATQMLWFVAPWLAGLVGGATAPSVYYATGALAFMHCAQYLWVTAYVTRAQAVNAATAPGWQPRRYAFVLVLGGIALFIPGPWIASSLTGVDLRESLIIFTAIVNLHHFVLDGVLWKLRDPGVAAVLINGEPASRPATVPILAPLRPPLRWALAGALLAIAAVDVCQRALTRDTATSGALALAQTLNPHDTRVDVRLAALLARTARDDAAIELLRPLVAANPMHAPAQRLLGSLLVAGERWDEAAACYQAGARRGALDAPGYVNLGVLHARAHDLPGAEAAFRQALALDPSTADAHLNLAEALWQQGRHAEAISGYEQYLTLADPHDAHGQRLYLLAALKLSEAQSRAGNVSAAAALLERAMRAAEHIDAHDLLAAAQAQAARLAGRSTGSPPAAP